MDTGEDILISGRPQFDCTFLELCSFNTGRTAEAMAEANDGGGWPRPMTEEANQDCAGEAQQSISQSCESQSDPVSSNSTTGSAAAGLVRQSTKPLRRLNFAGEEGAARRLKIVNALFQYKASLIGTGERSKIYKIVTEDLNKYDEMFAESLKENTVRDVWNKAVKEAEQQQVDKKEKHHLWYNGSVLREMSAWELRLDEIFLENQKYAEAKKAEAEAEQAEEQDKRARINAAFDRVNARADSNTPRTSPDKSGDDSNTENVNNNPYGRGNRKGNQHSAKLNPGLSPDPPRDKLSEACAKQAEIAGEVKAIINELKDDSGKKRSAEEIEVEREQLKIQKVQATVSLMETYLKFQQAGVELPDMFKAVLQQNL